MCDIVNKREMIGVRQVVYEYLISRDKIVNIMESHVLSLSRDGRPQMYDHSFLC